LSFCPNDITFVSTYENFKGDETESGAVEELTMESFYLFPLFPLLF